MSPSIRSRAHRVSLRTTLIAAALCSGIGLVAACSSGPANTLGLNGKAASRNGAGAFGTGSTAQGLQGAPMPVPADQYAGSTNAGVHAGPGIRSAPVQKLVPTNQSIIYTASMTFHTADAGAQAQQAVNLATAVGGYVSSQQMTHTHGGTTVYLELKIPVAVYQTTLTQLEGLKGKLVSLNAQAQDVTQQVVDLNSQITSTQDAITQLRALLRNAGSVADLLSVQNQINAEETTLEQLLAQQRLLNHQTTYATVALYLVSQHKHVVQHKKQKSTGFVAGLKAGWHALVVAVRWVLTAFGAALPIAIAVVVLALLAWWGRRRMSARRGHGVDQVGEAS